MKGSNQTTAGWSYPEPDGKAHGGNLLFSTLSIARETARDLHPASFALVMAIGSLSIATKTLGMPDVASALFWLNIMAFSSLWLLTIARLLLFSGDFVSDLFDSLKGPSFFTAVAGTVTVGSQFILIVDNSQAGMVWWIAGLFLWLCLAYAGAGSQTIKETESDGAEGANGGWGTAIAAAQSIATPSVLLALCLTGDRQEVLAFALAIAAIGVMLYCSLISVVIYRYGFCKRSPAAVLKSFALLFWATGTWWIPIRAVLGLSRHLYRGFPPTHPLYSGVIFALGTYAIFLYRLAELVNLPFLPLLARLVLFLALSSSSIVLIGLARRIAKRLCAIAELTRYASKGHLAPDIWS